MNRTKKNEMSAMTARVFECTAQRTRLPISYTMKIVVETRNKNYNFVPLELEFINDFGAPYFCGVISLMPEYCSLLFPLRSAQLT